VDCGETGGDREVGWIPAVLMPERAQLVDVEG
jgi:hypothetical protein